uniref:CD4-2 molecule, tandem duplicate 2 n=1 Tax=Cyprinus carpio TaxID=7962 RepID=A0A8C1Q695_CYPCA
MATCKILFFLFLALYISCGKCDVFYKRVGDEVSMNCGAPSNSDTEWKFDNVLIFNVKGKTGAKLKGPSHIVLKASTNGENLKVSRLGTRDSGNYICSYSGSVKEHNVYVVSVFAKPGPVLVQSSNAELHCDITGNSNTQVQWLRPPNGQKHNEKSQVIQLKSVTSKDAGQWTCQVKDDLTLSVTLTVVGWCYSVVVIHYECFFFITIILHITCCQIIHVQHRDAGKFVCTVEFEGGASLSVFTKGKGKTPSVKEILTKNVYGIELWVWIAVGASSVVLIGLIVVTVLVRQRNKRMKERVRKLRSMRQPLTAKDYCRCKRYFLFFHYSIFVLFKKFFCWQF